MARIILVAAFLLAILPRLAAEDTLDGLRREQRSLAATLHQKRTELLEKDQALKDLHRKIMELHKELALRLDNHRELRDLVKQMREVETKIRRQEAAQPKDDKPASEADTAASDGIMDDISAESGD
jgi:septal ring factor EnvC (AmiA/AmiB activator)